MLLSTTDNFYADQSVIMGSFDAAGETSPDEKLHSASGPDCVGSVVDGTTATTAGRARATDTNNDSALAFGYTSCDLTTAGRSWRTRSINRAVDKAGQTIDFLLTPRRDRAAAETFLHKAMRAHGLPEKMTIDQSGSNTAAIHHYNQVHKTAIVMRQSKYLNNLVEQDHRAVKRLTHPRLGFKSF